MSAQVLDCKAVAQSIQDQCKADADALRAKGIVPKLGIFRVGEKGPDLSYEKGATKTMAAAGIEVEVFALPAEVTQEDYIKKFKEVNADPAIHGILAFRPLDKLSTVIPVQQALSWKLLITMQKISKKLQEQNSAPILWQNQSRTLMYAVDWMSASSITPTLSENLFP